jgi:FkbM family methyltransferase
MAPFLEVFSSKVYELHPNFIAQPGYTVIDVGANIGTYTLSQGGRVGKTGVIYSFEPNPDAFQRLVANVRSNHLDWVQCYQRAVYSEAKPLTLQVPGSSAWARVSADSAIPEGQVPRQNFVPVEAITLDEFVVKNGIDKVDILKIDVEGSEVEVMKGAQEALGITHRVLFEYDSPELKQSATEILSNYGFNVVHDENRVLYLERGQ